MNRQFSRLKRASTSFSVENKGPAVMRAARLHSSLWVQQKTEPKSFVFIHKTGFGMLNIPDQIVMVDEYSKYSFYSLIWKELRCLNGRFFFAPNIWNSVGSVSTLSVFHCLENSMCQFRNVYFLSDNEHI